jgi:signal transduction histidine kinase
MRERVGAFGGSLEAVTEPGGGFRVTARIPVDAP